MRNPATLLVLLFTFCLVPVWADPGDLGTAKTEAGVEVRLTPDADRQIRRSLMEKAVAAIDQAVAEEALSELRAFRLRRELAHILAEPDSLVNDSVRGHAEEAERFVEPDDAMKNIRAILTEEWKEACGSLRAVVETAEQIQYLQGNYASCDGLTNEALKRKLNQLVSNHKNLGYTGARKVMFSRLDNENGFVTCVYTGRKVKTDDIPDAGGSQNMNTEHTWPKSLGAGSEPAKADLFHLYPTDTFANSKRSSYPFGNVSQAIWEEGGSKFDGDTFMPRADHRGNVARSMFYFCVHYGKSLDSHQENALRQWHRDDPVDAAERERNEGICQYQGNRNPFIDKPEFVDRISDF